MATNEDITNAFSITLEKPCEECEGKGGTTNDYTGTHYPCAVCDGTGYTLTEIGEHIFAFLRRLPDRERFRSRSPWPLG